MSAAARRDADAQQRTVVARPKKLTVEDVRRKAERVEEIARDEVDHVLHLDQTKMLMYAAVGVAVVAGLAYFMGTRAARRALQQAEPPQGASA
jgi:hypothetical protein